MTRESLSQKEVAEILHTEIEGGDAYLDSHGIRYSMLQIAGFLKEALDARPEVLYASAQSGLPDREKEILRKGGVDWERPLSRDFAAETAASFAVLAKQSLTSSEAASLTGLTPGRIRQLVSNREIFSFVIGKRRLLPSFQFIDNDLVPNISRVNQAISPTFHPVGVEQWYHQKNGDLFTDDEMEDLRSPLEWLREGRNPEPVCFLAENL